MKNFEGHDLIALVFIICCAVLIALGHDGVLVKVFCGIAGSVFCFDIGKSVVKRKK